MTPQHLKLAHESAAAILAGLDKAESVPGHIILAKYETQLDYETLRPEDRPALVEDHTEMIDHISATLAAAHPAIIIRTPILNASDYLRWLADTGKTNSAENRAQFIAHP